MRVFPLNEAVLIQPLLVLKENPGQEIAGIGCGDPLLGTKQTAALIGSEVGVTVLPDAPPEFQKTSVNQIAQTPTKRNFCHSLDNARGNGG